jgi:uncharacterized protein YoaH (UPF0181 family)
MAANRAAQQKVVEMIRSEMHQKMSAKNGIECSAAVSENFC